MRDYHQTYGTNGVTASEQLTVGSALHIYILGPVAYLALWKIWCLARVCGTVRLHPVRCSDCPQQFENVVESCTDCGTRSKCRKGSVIMKQDEFELQR